jgi:arylsulfatase A-like enzyme
VITPLRYRRRFLDEGAARASLLAPSDPASRWRYTFGLEDYPPEKLALINAEYDAALAELDDLLRRLLGEARALGALRNTIVVLCSDHGELLGEHHMLDHQYALSQPLLRVPLVLWYPGHVPPGRESRPVMNIDLHQTLLELAGLGSPGRQDGASLSLLRPAADRARLSEYLSPPVHPLEYAWEADSTFDGAPWLAPARALTVGRSRYLRRSDGREAFFDLAADPGEDRNLRSAGSPPGGSGPSWPWAAEGPGAVEARMLDSLLAALPPARPAVPSAFPSGQRELLRSLGYLSARSRPGSPAPVASPRPGQDSIVDGRRTPAADDTVVRPPAERRPERRP